jgi:hypothetical protein
MPVSTSSSVKSHLFYDRVPSSNTFTSMRQFYNMSRSIFASTNCRLALAISISISISVNGLRLFPISASFTAFSCLSKFPQVEVGNDNFWVISGIDSFFSVTNFKASSRNAFVYCPCGVLSCWHFGFCI